MVTRSTARDDSSGAAAAGGLRERAARVLHENSLSFVLFGAFLAMWLGQAFAGWNAFNEEQVQHQSPVLPFGSYLLSAHFLEATAENWESEFLQMAAYVLLTAWLVQRGSAESNPPDSSGPAADDPSRDRHKPGAPWPVRRGGWVLKIYENSLSLALGALFLVSFVVHAVTGAAHANAEHIQHGAEPVSALGYIVTAQFWFESLQNWQSEFFSVGVLAVLSIFLRQRGSPESKTVAAPNDETG